MKSVPPNSPFSVSRQAFEATLAVLPLINMSGDPEQNYLSEGMTEDLILRLSKVPGLFVISRDQTYSMARGQEKLDEIAVKLGGPRSLRRRHLCFWRCSVAATPHEKITAHGKRLIDA